MVAPARARAHAQALDHPPSPDVSGASLDSLVLEAEAEADAAEREADAAEREAEQAAKPADGRLSVRITTLKNISEVAVVVPSTSVRELKGMYEKLTGTRAGQQQMWFAVPTGTEGAVDVESFPWYAKSLANGSKPKALLDMIATHPLVQGMDDQTVGGIAALQNSARGRRVA